MRASDDDDEMGTTAIEDLEAALAKAVRAALPLKEGHRAFIGSHLLAQVDETALPVAEGKGLGATAMKKLIEELNAELTVVVNAARDREGWPVRAVATELLRPSALNSSCLMCEDRPRTVRCWPCGHATSCELCTLRQLKRDGAALTLQCGYCRAPVTQLETSIGPPAVGRALSGRMQSFKGIQRTASFKAIDNHPLFANYTALARAVTW